MFTKKPTPEPVSMASHSEIRRESRSETGPASSVLGADIAIKGDISASAALHIDGKIEGDITCSSLIQGESSEIVGGISAETARLAGKVQGSINTRELVILKTARIQGDVHYDALTIEQGAQVDGRLSPRGATLSPDTPENVEGHLTLASSSD